MKQLRLYLWLFAINFRISAFTFGGGYIVIPMIKKEFVEKKKLFGEEELMDLAAIAQSSPGAIAVNLSVLAGFKTAGFLGAVISCIAAVAPPIIILTIISAAYSAFSSSRTIAAILKGMEAGVAALIVSMSADMCRMICKNKHTISILLMVLAFIGSFVLQINVALILVFCVLISLAESTQSKHNKSGRTVT